MSKNLRKRKEYTFWFDDQETVTVVASAYKVAEAKAIQEQKSQNRPTNVTGCISKPV